MRCIMKWAESTEEICDGKLQSKIGYRVMASAMMKVNRE